jgi:hypothetical protein
MKETLISKIPNLFDLSRNNSSNFSKLAFILTYLLFPISITFSLLGFGIVMPNGGPAALMLFLAVLACCVFMASVLTLAMPTLKKQKRAFLYFMGSAITPFSIWYCFTLILNH